MILHTLIPLAMVFNPLPSPVNSFYDYGATLSCTYYTTTIPTPSDTVESCWINGRIVFTCNLSYDDADSWYLSQFNFQYDYGLYYYDENSSHPERDCLLSGSFMQYFEITPSSLDNVFDYITIDVGLNAISDSMYFNYEFEGINNYAPYSYTRSVLSDLTFDDWPSQKLEIEFDGGVFFNSVNTYTSIINAEQSQIIYTNGYTNGYTDGFNEGSRVDITAVSIFNGILNIGLVPINFFLAMFNFEVLGINISQLVSSILSICLVIIVVRFVTGKSSDGGA